MKLRGSMVEKEFKEILLDSWNGIKNDPNGILKILHELYGRVDCAFVLGWTPVDDQEIYTILVNGRFVSTFEKKKCDSVVFDVSEKSVKDYSANLKYRRSQIQLAVALVLSKEFS